MPDRLTPAQRSMIGRIGGNVRLAREGGHQIAAPARRGFELTIERRVVDPEQKLDPKSPEYAAARDAFDPDDLERRVIATLRAHMNSLALKSAAARARRKTA